MCSTVSGTGRVLGIGHTVVNPPRAAAFVPVSIVSLCSPPGSLNVHAHLVLVLQTDHLHQ